MTRGGFIYGLWCLGVIGLFLTASVRGYSPFADGRRAVPGVGGYYGPSHK